MCPLEKLEETALVGCTNAEIEAMFGQLTPELAERVCLCREQAKLTLPRPTPEQIHKATVDAKVKWQHSHLRWVLR